MRKLRLRRTLERFLAWLNFLLGIKARALALFFAQTFDQRFDVVVADEIFSVRIARDMYGRGHALLVVDLALKQAAHILAKRAHDVNYALDLLSVDVLILHHIHSHHYLVLGHSYVI